MKLMLQTQPLATGDLNQLVRIEDARGSIPTPSLRLLGRVIKVKDEIIAAMAWINKSGHLGLKLLVVDANFRRLGIGTQLITELRSEAKPKSICFKVPEKAVDLQMFLKANSFMAKTTKGQILFTSQI
jgi:GNAT superfamily N-acetyltransferase